MGKPPGYDRAPTEQEALLAPGRRPWTEYDHRGDKQLRPPFHGWTVELCLCGGPACCVWEIQLCEWCGDDADAILCKGHWGLCKMGLCFGPRFDDHPWCCATLKNQVSTLENRRKHYLADHKVNTRECFDFAGALEHCHPRFSGCQLLCTHFTCVLCIPGTQNVLCCREEMMMMDGDLKLAPVEETMDRPAFAGAGRGDSSTNSSGDPKLRTPTRSCSGNGGSSTPSSGGIVDRVTTAIVGTSPSKSSPAQRKRDLEEEARIKARGKPVLKMEFGFGVSPGQKRRLI